MGDKNLRYMFIMETHNGLTITVLICMVFLVNVFLSLEKSGKDRMVKWTCYIAVLLCFIVFLFIKARIYIAISFMFILFIGIQKFRTSRPLALAPLIYAVFFLTITAIGHFQTEKHKAWLLEHRSNGNYEEEGWMYFDNTRVLSSSGTGRMKLIQTFLETFREKGWQQFIYQNNVKAYYDKKAAIPNIDMKVSTLTENSYLVLTLYTGFLGLLVFLFIFAHYLWRFFKRKEYLSLLFMLFLMAVWFFEETILFPFSLITHLFALATVNYLETKKYESRISN
jgi:O-antigen ligase